MRDFFTQRNAPWVAFAVATAIMGLQYWLQPSEGLSLPRDLYGPGVLAAGVAPVILCGWLEVPFLRAVAIMGAVGPAVVFARVVVEGVLDPTSHNLWPFEVIIAAGVSGGPALAGGVAGRLLGLVRG